MDTKIPEAQKERKKRRKKLVIDNEDEQLATDLLTTLSSSWSSSDGSLAAPAQEPALAQEPVNPYKKIIKPKKKLSRQSRMNVDANHIATESSKITEEGDIAAGLPPSSHHIEDLKQCYELKQHGSRQMCDTVSTKLVAVNPSGHTARRNTSGMMPCSTALVGPLLAESITN